MSNKSKFDWDNKISKPISRDKMNIELKAKLVKLEGLTIKENIVLPIVSKPRKKTSLEYLFEKMQNSWESYKRQRERNVMLEKLDPTQPPILKEYNYDKRTKSAKELKLFRVGDVVLCHEGQSYECKAVICGWEVNTIGEFLYHTNGRIIDDELKFLRGSENKRTKVIKFLYHSDEFRKAIMEAGFEKLETLRQPTLNYWELGARILGGKHRKSSAYGVFVSRNHAAAYEHDPENVWNTD